jgi:hypothetical protein
MAGRVIPDLRTSYRFHANGEIKLNGTIEADMTMNANLNLIEDHDIKFVNGGNISNVSLVNGIDLSDWKSDYDSKIDQNVQLDSSPQFGDLKVATVVCPNYPAGGTGLFNTVDIKAFKDDYNLKVDQDVRTSAAPTFTGLTLGTVQYPSAPVATGYVLTQGEDGSLHLEEPNTTLPGRITLASGTANLPAYSWSLDDDTGIFYDSGTAFSHGGVKKMWVDGSGLTVDDDVKTTGTTTTAGLTVGTAPFSTSGTAPVYGCRAFAVFDGQLTSDYQYLDGTYARSGTTVTLSILTDAFPFSPRFYVGNIVYVDFTSGTATDGEFIITSATYTPGGLSTYEFTHGTSGATSGNFQIRLRTKLSDGGNVGLIISRTTGESLINFATAVPAYFSVSATCENGLVRFVTGGGHESTMFVRVLSVNTGGSAINSTTVCVNVIA